MSPDQSLNYHYLLAKLSKYARNQFTGRLTIQCQPIATWRIYFDTGAIIWATGGIHPVRRWLRQLKGCSCEMTVPKGMTKEDLLSSPYECWDYFALARLTQDQAITPQQAKYSFEAIISEVLFDLVQGFAQIPSQQINQIKMLRKQEVSPCELDLLQPAWRWDAESAKQQVLLTWQSWVAAGLSDYSPNIGIVANQDELQTQGWHALAQFLLGMEKQEKTLRDMAVENDKPLLSLLRTIKRYHHQNLIQFKSVSDLWQDQSDSHQSSGSSQGQVTGSVLKENEADRFSEINPIQCSYRQSLSTPTSGWRDYSSLNRRCSQILQQQAGVKINVMEALVTQEAKRQLKALPPKTREYLTELDIITYALNRLPPLYASSQEGIAHQTKAAKQNHQQAIQTEVQRAIAIIRRDPLRRTTRITVKGQI